MTDNFLDQDFIAKYKEGCFKYQPACPYPNIDSLCEDFDGKVITKPPIFELTGNLDLISEHDWLSTKNSDFDSKILAQKAILNTNEPLDQSQCDLKEIALRQVEFLNSIVQNRISNQIVKTSQISEYGFNNEISEIKFDKFNGQTILPPSLRLDIETKVDVYRKITDFYNQKEFLMKNGYGMINEFCTFCKNNNEPEFIYRSHRLKKNGSVICPILWAYKCPLCNATGENAHTIKYCPENGKNPESLI